MAKVFVYGTLKKGNNIRGLDFFGEGSKFVGTATTVDSTYALYDLGAFPAVSINGNQNIVGEVWDVNKATMKVLDGIEGYPTFYNRKKVKTTRGDSWMYFIDGIETDDRVVQISPQQQDAEWSKS